MTLPHSEPGFYGKLPILGDFVSRRLPRDFLNPWDSWLQSSIAASKEELGDAWLNSYLSSPIWRFALSPGVCGNSAWAGILMPSVDKVGRYFPLTVAASIDNSNCLAYLMSSAEQWFEYLEDAALSGLEDGLDPEVFDRLIKNIPAAPLSASEVSSNVRDMRKNAGKNAFYLSMARPESIADAFVGLSASLMNRFVPGFTLWSTGGSEDQTPALLACEGLPPIAAFSGFLNG
ncbi:MAG: type VI secretion system-associated protein TagF, partial [Methylomicrobium sp.]|nr:type VI secretion system-associated protein TagF [Methylomicrobium sp.]